MIGWLGFLLDLGMAFGPVIVLSAFAAGEVYDPGCRK